MPEMNASTLIATQKSFRALFMLSFDAMTPMWMKHVMETTSTNAAEIYQWLGRVSAMKEWVDSKSLDAVRGFDFTIKNKDWESTLEVKRTDIEDDQLGLYRPRIQDLGQRAKQHPDKLLSERRRAGTSTLCYDGQFFYDTDHAEGVSGAQSNLLTGTGTTAAQVRADLFTAKAALRKYKDDKGEPFILAMDNVQVIAVIPPDLERVFDELNNPAPGSTVPKTPVLYEVDPYLSDVNDWYLDYVGSPIRPFIKQNRKAVNFVALDDPNSSENVFMRQKLYYGVEGRYEVGYGLYQMTVKTTNT
jgi:phage major head subunit gpT-like protein